MSDNIDSVWVANLKVGDGGGGFRHLAYASFSPPDRGQWRGGCAFPVCRPPLMVDLRRQIRYQQG
ncbi:MAG: hypothetical protein OEV91_11985 [Desulfobulbaceae bacterium]|nr:hypothetical protein [Desulfobulbaceae bacterium]